jgi:ElaB/YqjD/DUF883 family membrane-anchored ribosome-binding protein
MSSVYDPPHAASPENLSERAARATDTLRQRVPRAVQNASRAATEGFRKISDSAGQLVDTPEKRNVTIGAVGTALGLGFLFGFLIGRASR